MRFYSMYWQAWCEREWFNMLIGGGWAQYYFGNRWPK